MTKMAIILCLQGLDVKAGTEDIRKFFKCLFIPNGGVYILGGRLKEAFIAFTTERDAHLAMGRTGDLLKGSTVTLHMSSMEELELKLKIQMKRKEEKLQMKTSGVKLQMKSKEEKLQMKRQEENNGKKPSPTQQGIKSPQPSPDANQASLNAHDSNTLNPPSSTAWSLDPRIAKHQKSAHQNTATLQTSAVHTLDPNTAFILGMCTVLQGLQSSNPEKNDEARQRTDFPKVDSKSVGFDFGRTPELALDSSPGYVRLFGLPASATKEDICHFFTGLEVQEAIIDVKLGIGHCCLVKFAKAEDACDALHFNKQFLGPICVEVRAATEKMWTSVLQECENGDDGEPHPNPLRETVNPTQISPLLPLRKRRSDHLSPVKRIKKAGPYCDSSYIVSPRMDHTVMVCNLPKNMTKTEIKELFQCPNIGHKNVLHLLDKEGNRTDTAFLIFNCIEDKDYAINLNGCHVGSSVIEVSSITKEKMKEMMAKTRPRMLMLDARMKPNQKRKSNSLETEERPTLHSYTAAQRCVFARNMPADVNVSQVKNLFSKYRLMEDNIHLLHDSDGNGIGEAIVQFKSQKLAALAQGLNGQNFLGTQVLLTCITIKQMNDILAPTLGKR